jgi:hypothetical protein
VTPADFAAWLDHMKRTRGWSAARCLKALGASNNAAKRWSDPKRKGPGQAIAYACAAIDADLEPWRPQHSTSTPTAPASP